MNANAPPARGSVVGDNAAPDYAKRVTEQMAKDYAESAMRLAMLLDEARTKPKEVTTDAEALDIGALVKQFRDLDGRFEAFRVAEKEPHLRGCDAVDAFFFGLRDKIGRRKKTDVSGAVDVLANRVAVYQERKLAEEQARRDLAAAEAKRIADAAAADQRRKEQEAETARLAADRARAPEMIEQKQAAASTAEVVAAGARVEAETTRIQAEDAHIDALAKPADKVRVRGDEGVMLTMKKEAYAIIEDDTKLDKEKLWPFISLEAKEKALRGWAKNTGHTVQMPGATVGTRQASVIR